MPLLRLKKPHLVTLFWLTSLQNMRSVNRPRREWVPSDKSLTQHSRAANEKPPKLEKKYLAKYDSSFVPIHLFLLFLQGWNEKHIQFTPNFNDCVW